MLKYEKLNKNLIKTSKSSGVTFTIGITKQDYNFNKAKYITQAIEYCSMLGYITNPVEKFIVTKLANLYYLVKK